MKRVVLIFLAGMLLLCLTGRAFAQSEASQPAYSSEANSGVRHEVCTSLAGTSVDTYYTGEYTFDTLSGLSGDALLQTLRTLMTTTHTHYTTYGDCRDLAVKTDCENGDGQTIPATGQHTYGEWTVEQAATETETGVKSRSCAACQDKVTEQIPSWSACQHSIITGAGNEDGTQLLCTICGYSRWEATPEPGPDWTVVAIVAAVVILGGGATVYIIKKKKQ